MKTLPAHSVSPYPANVRIDKASQVFRDVEGKAFYLGYVDKVQNWGNDFLARPHSNGGMAMSPSNRFFRTKTEAVQHILASHGIAAIQPDAEKLGNKGSNPRLAPSIATSATA